MNPYQIILLISLGLLLLTKLADLWTTVRHVGQQGESNPLARALFAKVGFAGGLAVVMGLWAVIVGMVYVSAWSAPAWIQVVTSIAGTVVAWVQWDVARFNATRRSSRLTRIAMRAYGRWSENVAAWRRKSG
jgi:cytochrome c biogenesis protein CcdA